MRVRSGSGRKCIILCWEYTRNGI